MSNFNIIREIKPKKSFRVASVLGKFDLQSEHVQENFTGDIDLTKEWQIGIIVGASGTGKSTIAKELFPDTYVTNYEYGHESILDDFPNEISVDEITKTFNSVGFSSPPSWLKPYSVLSNGEKMRVDLARALLTDKETIVFDEFTSVVDRNVAKIGSAAVAKSIRRTNKKFIAVACHYDIVEWLEPDWIFDTNEMKFEYVRGHLRRPPINVKIYERRGMWNLFKKYHYLNTEIAKSSRQFVAYINNVPVAFCGVMHFPHPQAKNIKKCTRLVVMPDYQGLGIGSRLLSFIAEYFISELKCRFTIVTSTPALLASFRESKHWKLKNYGRNKPQSKGSTVGNMQVSRKRITTSWEYFLAD